MGYETHYTLKPLQSYAAGKPKFVTVGGREREKEREKELGLIIYKEACTIEV